MSPGGNASGYLSTPFPIAFKNQNYCESSLNCPTSCKPNLSNGSECEPIMGIEIERKFLVKNDDWRKDIDRSQIYRQGYLKQDGKCTVRVRIGGNQAHLNIKGASKSISRAEYEYEIPMQEAGEMLDNLCVGSVIEKTRHLVKYGNHTWEIDVFQGVLHHLWCL